MIATICNFAQPKNCEKITKILQQVKVEDEGGNNPSDGRVFEHTPLYRSSPSLATVEVCDRNSHLANASLASYQDVNIYFDDDLLPFSLQNRRS